ncbi:hypothetical protein [Leptolyngbya iicbica]|uniref:Uncharacterized protein n=2 Tax=Cyanophyceae TaxID=3028117 RepID=A0A4Q7E5L3_9CYAN|nr:hypothetical protein [Leptolyngbya sp. LK]RZM77384.1 hypothetical protein DYY88_17265 [Leptolyngbya sp. LK]
MTRLGFWSALMVVGAISGSAEITQAQCIRSSNSILNRSAVEEDTSFVRSSPANSDSNFKLELDLNNGLDFLETEPEADEMTTEGGMETDTVAVEENAATDELATTSEIDEEAAEASAVGADSSSSAADLDTIDLQAQIEMSRADYLNSRASEINGCVE